jgi:TolB-like protein
VLALLAEHAGDLVSREELRQRIWGDDTFVDFERGLNFAIAQIRSALGDSAASPRFIETVPRRGYRFIAPVHAESGSVAPVADVAVPVRRVSRSALVTVAAVVGLIIVALVVGGRPWRAGPAAQTIRIAVVPFDNETGDATFDEVARGIADATVARLAGPDFLKRVSVIGNAAVLRKPRDRRDLKAIGEELGLQFVVLGQVKRDRERVRVIAHMIRVSDQTHMWANTFDRPAFTLAVQAELADIIARAVTAKLIGT